MVDGWCWCWCWWCALCVVARSNLLQALSCLSLIPIPYLDVQCTYFSVLYCTWTSTVIIIIAVQLSFSAAPHPARFHGIELGPPVIILSFRHPISRRRSHTQTQTSKTSVPVPVPVRAGCLCLCLRLCPCLLACLLLLSLSLPLLLLGQTHSPAKIIPPSSPRSRWLPAVHQFNVFLTLP